MAGGRGEVRCSEYRAGVLEERLAAPARAEVEALAPAVLVEVGDEVVEGGYHVLVLLRWR